jgi:hypothetical protein
VLDIQPLESCSLCKQGGQDCDYQGTGRPLFREPFHLPAPTIHSPSGHKRTRAEHSSQGCTLNLSKTTRKLVRSKSSALALCTQDALEDSISTYHIACHASHKVCLFTTAAFQFAALQAFICEGTCFCVSTEDATMIISLLLQPPAVTYVDN